MPFHIIIAGRSLIIKIQFFLETKLNVTQTRYPLLLCLSLALRAFVISSSPRSISLLMLDAKLAEAASNALMYLPQKQGHNIKCKKWRMLEPQQRTVALSPEAVLRYIGGFLVDVDLLPSIFKRQGFVHEVAE